jgi:hypothetical protein
MVNRTAPITAFWFIREGNRLIQVSKDAFDRAIAEGKNIKYKGYPNKKTERIAEQLEASRVAFLEKPDLSPKFRAALVDPHLVIEAEIITVDDPLFWEKESKRPKYL